MSLYSRGVSASSNLTYCTPISIYPLSQPQTLTLTLAKPALLLCSLRQYPLYSKSTPPAVLADHFTPQVFEKSQKYGKHKAKYSIVAGLYGQFIDTLQLASCLYYPWAWRASGQLLGLAGYGSEYLVCPQRVMLLGLLFDPTPLDNSVGSLCFSLDIYYQPFNPTSWPISNFCPRGAAWLQ